MVSAKTNTACCTIPPVVPKEQYKEKGEFKSYGPFKKAYIVGKPDTGKAIIGVYDIFGYWPQTLQGADILAETLDALVIYPDFFDGQPWDNDNFPPKTPADQQRFQEFIQGTANVTERVKNVCELADQLHASGSTFVGTYGLCWGGKVVTLAASTGKIDAAVSVHPFLLDVNDVENLQAPIAIFPSKDEPLDEYEKVVKSISTKPFASKNAYKVYSNMHHGWAGARANLDDPDNKREYEDVHGISVTFYKGVIAG